MGKILICFRLLPVIFCLTAFILAMLALFAGKEPGVLGSYDILTVDTSRLRDNLANKTEIQRSIFTRTTNDDCSNLGRLSDQACDSMTFAAVPPLPSSTTRCTNRRGSNANGGPDNNDNNDNDPTPTPLLRSFYSLYALAACEGDLTADGQRMITTCHPYFSPNSTSQIPALLLSTLAQPLNNTPDRNLTLADLGITSPLESALNSLGPLFQASTIIYSIGVAFTVLALLASGAAAPLGADSPRGMAYAWGAWTNLGFVSLALFFLILGGLVAAAGAKVAEGRVNALGGDVGVGAVAGKDWVAMAWAPVALMVGVLLYWVWRVVKLRRGRTRAEGGEAAAGGPPFGISMPPYPPRAFPRRP